MSAQVCSNCRNEKPVNTTDNRLVTESCGHVKCMDCLLHEKTGCQACLSEKLKPKVEEALNESLEGVPADDCPPAETEDKSCDDELDKEIECEIDEEYYKKKKLETSHIKVETGKSHYIMISNSIRIGLSKMGLKIKQLSLSQNLKVYGRILLTSKYASTLHF